MDDGRWIKADGRRNMDKGRLMKLGDEGRWTKEK